MNSPSSPTAFLYDELPLWSAPFGRAILDEIPLKRGAAILDLGCGLGFPLLELAERFGASSLCAGLDPWLDALRHAEVKRAGFNIEQAALACGVAEQMPFRDSSSDFIVSNNGINNVADIDRSLAECRRVLRPGGLLYLTVNLPGTMREFYDLFEKLLSEEGFEDCIPRLRSHIEEKRKPAAVTIRQVSRAGFEVTEVRESSFPMRFLDGTSFLRHHVMRWAFLPPWEEVVPEESRGKLFSRLEEGLNRAAARRGGLRLTIPYLLLSASKPERANLSG